MFGKYWMKKIKGRREVEGRYDKEWIKKVMEGKLDEERIREWRRRKIWEGTDEIKIWKGEIR